MHRRHGLHILALMVLSLVCFAGSALALQSTTVSKSISPDTREEEWLMVLPDRVIPDRPNYGRLIPGAEQYKIFQLPKGTAVVSWYVEVQAYRYDSFDGPVPDPDATPLPVLVRPRVGTRVGPSVRGEFVPAGLDRGIATYGTWALNIPEAGRYKIELEAAADIADDVSTWTFIPVVYHWTVTVVPD